jgi:hypothetical protein
MRVLFLFGVVALGLLSRPAAAQTGSATRERKLELSQLAQCIEKSCPELVCFDAASGLYRVREALLLPALRQTGQELATQTDEEAPVRTEALRALLGQLQRARQLQLRTK